MRDTRLASSACADDLVARFSPGPELDVEARKPEVRERMLATATQPAPPMATGHVGSRGTAHFSEFESCCIILEPSDTASTLCLLLPLRHIPLGLARLTLKPGSATLGAG